MSAVARWAPVALLAAAAWIMVADHVNLRTARSIETAAVPSEALPLSQPWGGYGWHALARTAGDRRQFDPDTALRTLDASGRRYPLDPWLWLDRAAASVGRAPDAEIDLMLERARAAQPEQRRALWRAAQTALRTGNDALAERHVRQWLERFPRDTGQALFVGRRWIGEPGELLDRMLPPGRDYLLEALKVAWRQDDPDLAAAAWARLDPKPPLDDEAFLDYVDLLLDRGDVDRAVALWAERDPAFSGEPGIVHARFDRALSPGRALDWQTRRVPAGVRIERDEDTWRTSPASLRVAFNGKENVRLAAPAIRIPVPGGRRVRVAGHWQADGLTTRALPYLLLAAPGAEPVRVGVPAPGFDWTEWQMEIDVPDDARLLDLTLRRDATQAFDRNIAGRLWLDDVTIEIVDQGPVMAASGESGTDGTDASGDPEGGADG